MVFHSPRILKDFDSYLDTKDLSTLVGVDVEYKVAIGLWTSKMGLQHYPTYVTLMQMFNQEFLDGLRQPLGDHFWPLHPMNKKILT
jgi:hypothetical protein